MNILILSASAGWMVAGGALALALLIFGLNYVSDPNKYKEYRDHIRSQNKKL
ncbi:MAG: hypothetical protein KBC17_03685 [Candidatus Pacebacteria bacterium]|nr:hypothetical protein [Candidatus Paceibacterota bacterium]